jgi:sugar lactone lactonase YvrE
MEIAAGGAQRLIGKPGLQANGHDIVPNGIARRKDGSFLIANIGEGGGVWTLDQDTGALEGFVMEADGWPVAAANFVMIDHLGRIWITVSTRSLPRYKAYSNKVADGFIVLHDDNGTRVVADGIGFANECRITPDGTGLVVAETFGRRVTRFDLADDGGLSDPKTVAQFGHGDFPDGCRYHSDGHLWLTSIVSNRLYRIAPDGGTQLVLEDCDPAHVDWVETALAAGTMERKHFYQTGNGILHNIASVAFGGAGGPDERTVYLGSLANDRIASFNLPGSLAGDA